MIITVSWHKVLSFLTSVRCYSFSRKQVFAHLVNVCPLRWAVPKKPELLRPITLKRHDSIKFNKHK